MEKWTLRSLSPSYQKKDYKIYSVKVAAYRFTVDVMPKEGLVGPCLPITLLV